MRLKIPVFLFLDRSKVSSMLPCRMPTCDFGIVCERVSLCVWERERVGLGGGTLIDPTKRVIP